MSKADEALADVRRWLCDNLSDGDAGKVCGMLSVVSRRIAEIEEENAHLRELLARMAEALGIDCEWADPNWCKSPCVLEFGCWTNDEHAEILCPAWAAMRELGIEVDG